MDTLDIAVEDVPESSSDVDEEALSYHPVDSLSEGAKREDEVVGDALANEEEGNASTDEDQLAES